VIEEDHGDFGSGLQREGADGGGLHGLGLAGGARSRKGGPGLRRAASGEELRPAGQ
jgi:hypothetical protein